MKYDEWLRLGERLHLSGEDLARFIQQKEDEFIAREERAQKREDCKRMLEMQHEYQMKDQELQLERLRLQRGNGESSTKSSRPKLPKFDEKLDDMDAYIERFERFARGQGWEEDTWATSLSSLLSGKGLEVYTSMPPEEANIYTSLKVAVLKRYQQTEEGFRLKFRNSKQEAAETVHQYVARLRRYLSRWTEMAQADGTYESFFDLMLREQFLQSCSQDTAMFLKERAPTSIVEATRLAEQYVEAHGGKFLGSKCTSNGQPRAAASAEVQDKPNPILREGTTRKGDISGKALGNKTCFICNRSGHFARGCRQRYTSSKNEKRIGATCMMTTVNEKPKADDAANRLPTLENGEFLPIISGGCTLGGVGGTRNLDIQRGFVGTSEVKVLRDTGCEMAAVRKELVKKEQYLEKQIAMITIDGEAKIVPTARIDVDTPYYVGELEVMVPKSLICDLIIGNVPGVTDQPDPCWVGRCSLQKLEAEEMARSQFQSSKLKTSVTRRQQRLESASADHTSEKKKAATGQAELYKRKNEREAAVTKTRLEQERPSDKLTTTLNSKLREALRTEYREIGATLEQLCRIKDEETVYADGSSEQNMKSRLAERQKRLKKELMTATSDFLLKLRTIDRSHEKEERHAVMTKEHTGNVRATSTTKTPLEWARELTETAKLTKSDEELTTGAERVTEKIQKKQ